MGDKTVNTQTLPDAESVIVTRQYLVEVYLITNGNVWTAASI